MDFYLWEQNIGIQVAWSLAEANTRRRETEALVSLSKRQHLKEMLIVTFDETEEIRTEEGAVIRVVPIWEWLLGQGLLIY